MPEIKETPTITPVLPGSPAPRVRQRVPPREQRRDPERDQPSRQPPQDDQPHVDEYA